MAYFFASAAGSGVPTILSRKRSSLVGYSKAALVLTSWSQLIPRKLVTTLTQAAFRLRPLEPSRSWRRTDRIEEQTAEPSVACPLDSQGAFRGRGVHECCPERSTLSHTRTMHQPFLMPGGSVVSKGALLPVGLLPPSWLARPRPLSVPGGDLDDHPLLRLLSASPYQSQDHQRNSPIGLSFHHGEGYNPWECQDFPRTSFGILRALARLSSWST